MNTVVGKLIYKITGDNRYFKEVLADSSKRIDTFARKAKPAGALITRHLTGSAFIAVGKELVNLGAEAEKLRLKFSAVFGDIAGETDHWIAAYADAVNQGRNATRAYLTSLQDMRTGFGDSIPAAAEFSKAVLGLGNDLSSFSHISLDTTFQALRAALSGNLEALREFGIGLDAAAVDQGEYAASLGKTWLEMSNLEKQEAVLSGVMQQSGNAIRQNITHWRDYNYQLGSTAAFADTAAGKGEGLRQSIRDVGAEFGATLLPHVSTLLDVGGEVIQWADDLSPAMKELSFALAGLGAAFALGGWVGLAVAGISAVVLGIIDARDRTDELAEATDRLESASRDYQKIAKELEGDLSGYTDEQVRLLELQKEVAAYEAEQALYAYVREQQRFNRQQEREAESLASLKALNQVAIDFANNLEVAGQEYFRLRTRTDSLTVAERARLDAFNEYARRVTRVGDALRSAEAKAQYQNVKKLEIAEELAEKQKKSLELEVMREETIESSARLYNGQAISLDSVLALDRKLYEEILKRAAALKTLGDAQKDANSVPGADTDSAKKSWKEYLEEILDVSQEQSQRGATAARAFIDGFDREIQADRTLHESANGTLDGWDPVPLLEWKREEIQGAIKELLSIDENEIDVPFRVDLEGVRELLGSLKQVEDELKDLGVNLDAEVIEEYTRKLEELNATEMERLILARNIAIAEAKKAGRNKEAVDAIRRYYDELINQQREVLIGADEYRRKLEEMQMTEEERIEAERALALARAKAHGASAEELAIINAYYDQLVNNIHAGGKAVEDWKWDDWANFALDAVQKIASALESLNRASTKLRLDALDKQMNAELAAMGLLEDKQKNRYTAERETAQRKLKDLQNDLRTAKTLERRNELKKAAEEKAIELDKLAAKEAQEEKKMAIEERYARKKAQVEYEGALMSWNLKKVGLIASTAQAVMAAWAAGPIIGPISSAIALAVGAIQLAALEMARPQPPSFAVGAWDVPQDMLANIHAGEMILPKPFAESVRSGEGNFGASPPPVVVQIYANDQVESDEGEEDGVRKIRVFVGREMIEQFNSGALDNTMLGRYGVKKRGLT